MIPCPITRASKKNSEKASCITLDMTLTFKDLKKLTEGWETRLYKMGVLQGDKICTILKPSPDLISLLFAAWRLGASVAILNPNLPLKQIESFLEEIQPQYTLGVDHKTYRREIPLIQSLLVPTSGSSGNPKIAVLSLSSLYANALNSIPLSPSDRWLLSLPLYHVSGIGILLRCILSGAAIVFNKNHPEITHLSFVPTQLYRESPVYRNLKCVLLGGAPIPELSSPLPIFETYGLTEMGSMVLARKKPPIINGQKYLGFPLPGREMRLGKGGEIFVRGETRFDGYLQNGTYVPIPKDVWFATKDIGIFDPQEGFAILGRKDLQFICGGENIQPEEIEQYILKIPGILEAVVIPQKDPEFGAKPIAIIHCLTPHFSLQEMTQILTPLLPKYKIPKALYINVELPKKGSKIDRQKIIATYSQ